MAAGAAERNREIALPFAYIVRQQINQKLRNPVNELPGLREGAYVTRHSRVPPRQLFKFRNVVRVRQKSHVENQIAVRRNAMAKTEAVHIDHNLVVFLRVLE